VGRRKSAIVVKQYSSKEATFSCCFTCEITKGSPDTYIATKACDKANGAVPNSVLTTVPNVLQAAATLHPVYSTFKTLEAPSHSHGVCVCMFVCVCVCVCVVCVCV